MKSILVFGTLMLALSCLVSCETFNSGPEPERDRISSMPHNMPQSWEGTQGFPGGGMGGSY